MFVEYPKMLFRDGSTIEVDGLSLDFCNVADEAEEAAAIKNGWRLTTAPQEAPEKPLAAKPRRKKAAE